MSGLGRFLLQPPSPPSGKGLSLLPINKHPLPQATGCQPESSRHPPHHPLQKTIQSTLRGKILGHMCGPREHFPLQKTMQSTLRSNMFGHICLPCEHFPLQKTIQIGFGRGPESLRPLFRAFQGGQPSAKLTEDVLKARRRVANQALN